MDNSGTIKEIDPNSLTTTISFMTKGNKNEPIMKLTAEGMFYKGKFIEDAGEAHKAFLEVMQILKEGR